MTTTLHICITCKKGGIDPDENAERAGAHLYAAVQGLTLTNALPEYLRILPVKCLSACNTGCAVALSATGKWAYVYGHMNPENDAADILEGARKYAASLDGIVPWRERPVIFRKQSLARIPPLEPS
ncbi:MAG: DUF1636 domain-containing protein [Paracoccaceae bacterium]|jgi:predicted metal-binding protein